jgi:hypothetical protein
MAETTKELRAIQLADMGKLDHFDPVGSSIVFRLDSRQWFRPAGNSIRFWKKIEADDPFKPKRAKLSPHRPVYASGRFVRLEDVTPPKPKPKPQATPKARRLAKAQPEEDTKGPSQVHTPDRKLAPSPLPKPAPSPEPEAPKPVAKPAPTEPIDRTPPRIIPNQSKKISGRIRTGGQPQRRSRKLVQGGAPPTSRSPEDAPPNQASSEPPPDISPKRNLGKRESPPPPPARNIDSVLGALGALKAAQEQFEHDKDLKAQGLLPDSPPQQSFSPPPAESRPKPTPTPKDPSKIPPTARKRTFGTESAPAPEARDIDSVLGVLGALKAAQDQHAQQKKLKEQGLPSDQEVFGDDGWRPPPKPKRIAGTAPAEPPAPKPAPRQAAPPPRPKPKAEPAPPPPAAPPKKASPNRAPPKPGGGSLDDLFGGGNEGRLRIGKRTKPKPSEED